MKPHTATPSQSPERLVTCPGCGGDSLYAVSNVYRPFCSARCKNLDLGSWANEDFRMPAKISPEDLLTDDQQ
jgi:hypothetical protein